MKILEIQKVFKEYPLDNNENFFALQDINLSFDKGELVSVIGESGSGKSTLMNIIGGLDSNYQGKISICEQNLKEFNQKELDDYRKKKIGFVFQSFNLISHLSVLDNVTIGLTLSNEKDSVKNTKAIELLTKLGLKNQIKKKPTQLSGGQKQRVAIARALINDPDIILADEPTGSLDSSTTVQILKILKEIADDGKLVIMVTHSEKVAQISSRIIELSDGKIVKDEKKSDYQPSINQEKITNCQTVQNAKEGHLSLLSAIKLSFHNMMSSKVKNILIAIGVSISLAALIIMMSFGAGLTDYISTQANKYIDPNYAIFSKGSIISPEVFEETEIDDLVKELNQYLKDKNIDFEVKPQKTGETDFYNLTYGFNLMTATSGEMVYTPKPSEENPEPQNIVSKIFYTYTTPPYYGEKQLLTENSTLCGDGEIMLSSIAAKILGIQKLEDVVGEKVTLNITLGKYTVPPIEVKISGIVDASILSPNLIMFIDYDFLKQCVKTNSDEELKPSLLYIETDNPKITEAINSFKASKKIYSGSIEEKLVNMFNEMLDTVSLALAIIAGISLAVALIMILVVLYMSVSERTREIGILKSIGARGRDIRKIFSTESLLIGVLSGITGIILTLITAIILKIILICSLGFAPLKLVWYYFILAFVISIVISFVAGLYPAYKAAKLDPVESLRHE